MAEQVQEQVLHISKDVLGESHPDTVQAMSDLALIYLDQGRKKDTITLERQAQQLRKGKNRGVVKRAMWDGVTGEGELRWLAKSLVRGAGGMWNSLMGRR